MPFKLLIGRVPVIAGTGSNCTKYAIELSKYCESIGIDGLLVVTPYYNKTSKKGLIAHYTAIAENTSLPIILYNVPSRTGMNLTPEICFELSKLENIVAIKEASRKYITSCRNCKSLQREFSYLFWK